MTCAVLTTYFQFIAVQNALYASPRGTYKDPNPLANITILGVPQAVHHVRFNDVAVPASSHGYNATSKTLTVTGLEKVTQEGAWSADWVLTWS